MLEKVKRAIEEYNMINEGEAVLCCLSGGADSVSLVLCLKELGVNVRACHVNHNLRGEESDRDERFCRELCERLGIPLEVLSADVKGYCEKHGLSVEEGARKLRYEFFKSLPADRIATAHTLSDSLETALFNLARGTGAKGLCGIPPVRGKIIRPLILCTREEIEAFLAERDQSFVTDSTNLSDNYSRNRIRHGVVPVLKEISSGAEQAFARLSDSLRLDNEYLEAEAEKLLASAKKQKSFDSKTLSSAAEPVLSRAVIAVLKDNDISYDSRRVTELCELLRSGGRLCLSGNVYALCSGGMFRIARLSESENAQLSIPGSGEYELCGRKVCITISGREELESKVHNLFTYIAFDYDKINGELVLRTRLPGDSIRLENRGCTKSLKKLFNESVPLEDRADTLLLSDDEGVLAVWGIGISERAAITGSTKTVLIFSIS